MEHVSLPIRRTSEKFCQADTLFLADETDLSFCGEDSEEKHLTFDTTVVEYDEECMLCPGNIDCETMKYLSAGTEITVTCWTAEGITIAGDTYVGRLALSGA